MSSKTEQDPAEILKDDLQMEGSEDGDEVSAILDELVAMFVKENKRTPTDAEMKQWIKVFRSLNAGEGETE